jgi:hypothetical protein
VGGALNLPLSLRERGTEGVRYRKEEEVMYKTNKILH